MPWFSRPQLPESEDEIEIAVGFCDRPVVDYAEVQLRVGSPAVLTGTAEVLHIMAFGAERDQAHKALTALHVIELPPLVAGNAILMTDAIADFASVVRRRVRSAA